MDSIWQVTFLLAMGINLLLFFPAAFFKSDKLTDLAYSLTFIIITWYTVFTFAPLNPAQILLVGLISIWGVRLGGYLVLRIWKTGRDRRFDKVRDKPNIFIKFWLMQGIVAWVILVPTIIFLSRQGRSYDPTRLSVGLIVFALGLFFETVADWQKYRFKKKRLNKTKLIMSGLWRHSRHPNYFGEICVWTGVFIYASAAMVGWDWLSVVSPVLIAYLLIFVSGIPPLEKRYAKQYAMDKEYRVYKKTTSLLVPWPQDTRKS